MNITRIAWPAALCVTAFASCLAIAQAPAWPTRPIALVDGNSPGSSGDLISRLFGQALAEALGQPVLIENKPGAGGLLAAQTVAKAAPDGYTLLNGTSATHGTTPWLHAKPGYDPIKDFEPIALLATTDFGLAVPASSPAKSVADLIAMGRKARLQYASTGNGTTSHLAAVLFGKQAKIELDHIPYKGQGPAITDLVAERVSFYFANTSGLVPHAKAGKVRILATTGTKRSAATPETPTMIEAGMPGYEVIGWWALFAPAGTPTPIVDRLYAEARKIVGSPAVVAKVIEFGNAPAPAMSQAEARTFVKAEYEKLGVVVKDAGLRIE